MRSIYDYTYEDLQSYFLSKGEAKFRSKQIFNAVYKNFVSSIDEITTINKDLKERISNDFVFDELEVVEVLESRKTVKYLFKLADGNLIETVLMRQVYGNSVCVTTQVGCNMGCKFCASGTLKKLRNLTTAEIVLQVLMVQKLTDERVSNVVVMGIGEPFDNFDNVIKFLSIINSDLGLAIGARHITISTSGVIPKIIEFANLNTQFNLAISLHAPSNDIRSRIMPINDKYDMALLKDAMLYYCENTNRRLTIEYVLIKGVNDSANDAKMLHSYLRGVHCYVNLIPLNSVDDQFKSSDMETIEEFESILAARGMNVRIRQEFGEKINAACGQLRARGESNET